MGSLIVFVALLILLSIEFTYWPVLVFWFAIVGIVAAAVVAWSRSHDERT